MAISAEALKGYLLEEALAYLIRNTGYKLLVDEKQDNRELKNGANGLLVQGRGSLHQADVLGELSWVPAFTYPIRLFVEAKFRGKKTGITTVRNAIGVLNDINQNLISANNNRLIKRYSYNYALFSTSGFTKYAIDLAVAHGISLIDLSDCGLDLLLESISTTANTLTNVINENRLDQLSNRKIYTEIRNFIRKSLDTYPEGLNTSFDNTQIIEEEILYTPITALITNIRSMNELFVAMVKGPFMIVLTPENYENFINYARQNPKHQINITWSSGENHGRTWTIGPHYGEQYRLKFKLPESLAKNIFSNTDYLRRAIDVKSDYFSELTIFHKTYEQDYLFKLKYVPRDFMTEDH